MPESFTDTFGMMLVAFFIDSILYGIGLLMVFQYFRTFSEDPIWPLKAMVGTLSVLMAAHIATFFAWVYWDLITLFGLPLELNTMPRTALVQLLAIYLTAFITQCFFASRVWRLSHGNVLMTGFIMSLALLQIGAGIAQTTLSGEGGTFSNLVNTKTITTIQSGATAACDLSITIILCWVLHGSRTGIQTTDALLDKLITYAINRGALTTLAAFLNMILFVLRPEAMIFMIPLLPSGQLYVISVVATLNARKALRENTSRGGDMALSSVSANGAAQKSGGVHVTKSIVTWTEDNHGQAVESGSDEGYGKKKPELHSFSPV